MKFDKSRCITKDSKKLIYIDNIDTDETLMLDEEYTFLENLKTTQDIVITKKVIVLGDIECNFLNALGEIVCYGNIKANTIYTNRDIECIQDITYNSLLGGNINKKKGTEEIREVIKEVEVFKEIEKVKEVEIEVEKIIEVNPFEDTSIDSDTLPDQLTIIDNFKEKIMNYIDSELIFLDENILVEDLEQLGVTFVEFKSYSEKLSKIIEYSEIVQIKTLNDYIEFLNIIKDIPDWLEEIDIIQNIIDRHKVVDEDELLEFDINIDTQNEFVNLLGSIASCKETLAEAYEYISYHVITKYYKNIKDELELELQKEIEKKESADIVSIIKDVAKELDDKPNLEELYDRYIWEKGSLVECKVVDIDDNYIYAIKDNEEKNKYVSIKMKKHFINRYKIDDTLYAHISEVEVKDNYIDIIISNELENMPRLLFNKLKEKYGLNKCTIQKYKRRKGKSICIVIVVFDGKDHKEEIEVISQEMKKHLNGEHIGIFVYDRNHERFAANILGIDKSDINVDTLSKKCIVSVGKEDELRIRYLLETQGSNIKNIYEYEIELKQKEIKNIQQNKIITNTKYTIENIESEIPEYTKNEVYKRLLGDKGKLVSGKIINILPNEIHVDIGYDADATIKYFNEEILKIYKVGDYIEAVIDNLSKKEDGSVKATLARDDVDFVKAVLKEIRNNLGFKHITFKAAKRLTTKNEYAVLANFSTANIINKENQFKEIKNKVEEKLYDENIFIYEYNKSIVQQIKNITKLELENITTDDKISVCNIVCSKDEYKVVKDKKDIIQSFAGYKVVNIIEEVETELKKDNVSKIDKNNNYSESYFTNMFTRIKSELNLKHCNIKKCAYDINYGVLLVIENKFKTNTSEEIRFIESLMNKECKEDIVKIVEFKYDAYSFLSDLFDIGINDIQQIPGKFYIKNLNESNINKYKFIRDEAIKLVNYKIEI